MINDPTQVKIINPGLSFIAIAIYENIVWISLYPMMLSTACSKIARCQVFQPSFKFW